MKSRITAIALFAITAATVALFPLAKTTFASPQQPPVAKQPPIDVTGETRPKVEVVFVLDTTGSMGGLIAAAKEKIWSIATTMASANDAPEIKMGLVAYRDRGDAYVTRVVDLSSDLDSMYATLMDFRAAGGGDTPESVNQALHDAVHRISWSQDPDTYRVVFLVGDAPPQMRYQDEVKYPQTLADAKAKGIVVNAIQCGNMGATVGPWRQIAQLGDGQYFRVDQAGSAVAVATPFDEKMASLSRKLDGTRLFYGDAEERARQERKLAATEKLQAGASDAAKARRAEFNSTASGAKNLGGEGDLVDDLATGRVELDAVPEEALPSSLQALPAPAREAAVAEVAKDRREIQAQIKELAKKRADYIKREVGKSGGARDSLDQKLYDAVRSQAGKAGIVYESEAPTY